MPNTPRLPSLPLLLIFSICCGLPLAWMLLTLLAHPAAWREIGFSSFQLNLLARTILYNGAVALLATLIALPAAFAIGRGRGWSTRLLLLLVPLALVLPSISYAYGWQQLFRILPIPLVPADPLDILRCIWTLACWLWPLPALAIGLSLRQSDPQVQQQALLDGAYWRITFRQLVGPILASLALVLILAMQEFGVYEWSGISVTATEIRTVFETGALSEDDPQAITALTAGADYQPQTQPRRAAAAVATALPVLLLTALLTIVAVVGLRRGDHADRLAVDDIPRILHARWPAHLGAWLTLALTLLVPTLAMLLSISPRGWQRDDAGRHPLHQIWLWASPEVLGSLLVGAITAAAALLIALLATVRPARWLLLVGLVLFLIGGELLAIANIRIYNTTIAGRAPFSWIYNNLPIMVILFIGRFGWLPLLAAHITWSRPFREIRDVAALDGAGPWRTCALVIWPIAWPLLAASALLVMILSMTEVPGTLLLSPLRPPMLIPRLMQWAHIMRDDQMLQGSLLLMAMAFVLALASAVLAWLFLSLRR